MLQKEGVIRIPSGCAIAGIINRKKKTFSGDSIITSISLMHDRSNGLGGGFAAYGIYPGQKELYAIHIFFDSHEARMSTEKYLGRYFDIESGEMMPTRKSAVIKQAPLIWRYFAGPKEAALEAEEFSFEDEDNFKSIPDADAEGAREKEFVVRRVMHINSSLPGAFVASCGKNMGAFKAVGYPEDVGEFYMLDKYRGYLWTAHGRFPTNTPGWWGGAHPFTLLDMSVVHNGEISSYDANRRYLEMFGYKCTLQTDTEAITYILDLITRKHGLPLSTAMAAMAAPFWDEISRMPDEMRDSARKIRIIYGSALVNGPFSIILGCEKGMFALNDRIKLRSLIAAEKGDYVYAASEESAIRAVCNTPERVWSPRGGELLSAGYEEADHDTENETVNVSRYIENGLVNINAGIQDRGVDMHIETNADYAGRSNNFLKYNRNSKRVMAGTNAGLKRESERDTEVRAV